MKWRHAMCFSLIAVLPWSLLGQEAAAILHSNGPGVQVNGQSVPTSTALFSHDLIETQKDVVSRIEVSGSTADLNPGTLVQFEVDELRLEHGSLSVNTSRGLKVRVGCLVVEPANDAEWTHYDVSDTDGKVKVSALKSDVNIDTKSNSLRQAKQTAQSNRVSVREGEQKSREEKCTGAMIRNTAYAGAGGIMNSPWAIGVGAVAVAAMAVIALWPDDDPISPAIP